MSTVIIAVAALIETDFLCFWNPKVYCFISTVFGRYFQTEYIHIRIRLLFFNRIYLYSYSVYDNIQIIFAFQLTWKYNLTALKPVYKEDKNQSVAVLGIPTSTTPNTTPRTSTTPSTTHRITKSTTPSTTPTTNPNNAPNTTPSTTSITTTKHPRLHDAVFMCTGVGAGGQFSFCAQKG